MSANFATIVSIRFLVCHRSHERHVTTAPSEAENIGPITVAWVYSSAATRAHNCPDNQQGGLPCTAAWRRLAALSIEGSWVYSCVITFYTKNVQNQLLTIKRFR